MRRSSYLTLITLSVCAVVLGGAVRAQTGRGAEPSVACAHVNGDGTLDIAHSKNVVTMGGGNGLYCFKLAFIPKSATATIAYDPTAPNQGLVLSRPGCRPLRCLRAPRFPTRTPSWRPSSETSIGGGESGGGYAFYVLWTR